MREIMDHKKILIINLSKGKIGEDASKLLGALLITKIQLAAMSRVDIKEEERKPFYLYVDEFQNFATESFATILSEARKYKLSLILAHQYISQMDDIVRGAVFGNIGTMITFRIGAEDAEDLRKEFSPEFTEEDLVNLAKQFIYVRLMIDGITSRPFSAETLAPRKQEEDNNVEAIINFSRKTYGRDKIFVDDYIRENIIDEKQEVKTQRQELHDAICSECQKRIKIPFKPDTDRKVFCKTCLRKQETGSVSLKEASKDFVPKERKDKEKLDELKNIISEIKKEPQAGKINPGEHIKFEE